MCELAPDEMMLVLGGLKLPPHPPAGLKLSNGRPVTQANWDYWQMVLKDIKPDFLRKLQDQRQQRPIGWDPNVPGGGILESVPGR